MPGVAPDPVAVATRFNDCVNRRDLAGLAALMPADHSFVDAASDTVSGRQACVEAWRGFFALFPDYRNVFESFSVTANVVVIAGRSVCSTPALAGPALWTATIEGDQVAKWHVHEDTPEVRENLGLPRFA